MPKSRKVRINQGRIIPLWLRLLLTVGMFSGILYAILFLPEEAAVLISIVFAIPVFPMWNAYYLFEIDNDSKTYFNGYWAAGITWGKWNSYQEAHGINIQGPKDDRPGSHRSGNKPFKAFFVTGDGTEVFVLGNSSRTRLEELVKEINTKLQMN